MLNRSSRQRARLRQWRESHILNNPDKPAPSVALILDIDAQYRRLAGAGKLRTIAPRRFNPNGKRWLPVMHVKRDGWWFSALYSNTARAHELGKTHDWVIIYYEQADYQGQCTVVTETRGVQRGKRVVRGYAGESSSTIGDDRYINIIRNGSMKCNTKVSIQSRF